MDSIFRRHDVDIEQMRLMAQLSPAKRIEVWLDARDVAVGFIRSRLRLRNPNLSPHELNLKLLEEIERVQKRTYPRF